MSSNNTPPAINTNGTTGATNVPVVPPPNGPVGSLTGNYTKELDSINLVHKEGTEPSIIQLRGADGQTIMDSIDASYEDSFCLDSLKDLTLAHQEAGKFFIIARVQTWDRKQPEKAYYSYYNAYHLNKILFQTQWFCGKRLIHRLLVLNPLTNTDIVGDVQYFMVRTRVKATADTENDNQIKDSDSTTSKIPNESPLSMDPLKQFLHQNAMAISNSNSPMGEDGASSGNRGHRRRSTAIDIRNRVHFYMKKSLPPKLTTATSYSNQTKDFDQDSLFLGSSVIEGKRQRTASLPTKVTKYNNQRRYTAIETDSQLVQGFKTFSSILGNSNGTTFGSDNRPNTAMNNDIEMGDISKNVMIKEEDSEEVHQHKYDSHENIIAKTVSTTNNKLDDSSSVNSNRRKSEIQAGTVTQFHQPVPEDLVTDLAPPTPKSHRRTLSFLNSPSKTDNKTAILDKVAEWESGDDRVLKDETCFDAILIGTDNDYLETSRMRAIFRENSLTDDDVTLFEMPAVMSPSDLAANQGNLGSLNSPFMVGDTRFRERSWFYQCICTPPPSIMDTMSPGMQLFHHCKCYLTATLIIFILFFLTFSMMQQSANAASQPRKN